MKTAWKNLVEQNRSRSFRESKLKSFVEGTADALEKAEEVKDKAWYSPFTRVAEPSDLKVDHENVISEGYFGKTFRGTYKDVPVAVKVYRSALSGSELKAVLLDIKIMAYLGDHPYLVALRGADVSRLTTERTFQVAVELSSMGDLLTYLQRNFDPEKEQKLSLTDGVQVHKSVSSTMLRYCLQITTAMEFLESKQIVHGYLQAKNVLLFGEDTIKLTGPRLSRQLYDKGIYSPRKDQRRGSKANTNSELSYAQAPFQWRWASVELLRNMQQFSSKSDVWAFGVTAWEIFSLGQIPYHEYKEWSVQFVASLELGQRLGHTGATTKIYKVLQDCWKHEPSERPTFSELKAFFSHKVAKFEEVA